jgi:hypothetical protein
MWPFPRRLAFAPIVLLVVAAVTYGVPRILRPDLFPGQEFASGLVHDLDRAFLQMDFGCSGILPGCPSIHDLWVEGLAWDLWLLGGAVVLGTAGGIAAGTWCAGRPRSLTFSFVGVSAPLIIPNMVLVERTLSVPGLIADGIVSLFDPRVRMSSARAW